WAACQPAPPEPRGAPPRKAVAAFRAAHPDGKTLVVAGGVAANKSLRAALSKLAADNGLAFVAPPQRLCTDNGAMIAWAGLERLRLGMTDRLDFAPRPRWPLDHAAARPEIETMPKANIGAVGIFYQDQGLRAPRLML